MDSSFGRLDSKLPQSILDFRDVSSVVRIQPGRLFRCASLEKASSQDRDYLRNILGIKTIINLRGPPDHYILDPENLGQYKLAHEDRIHRYDVLDITVHEIGLNSKALREAQGKKVPTLQKAKAIGYFLIEKRDEAKRTLVKSLYRNRKPIDTAREILDLSQTQLKAVFEALAEEDAGPVLICGPDRGQVVLLILSLLGVPEEEIVRDYMLSDEWKGELESARREDANEKGLGQVVEFLPLLEFGEEFVVLVRECLDVKYRGVEAYVAGLGIGEEQVMRIRRRSGGKAEEKILVDVWA